MTTDPAAFKTAYLNSLQPVSPSSQQFPEKYAFPGREEAWAALEHIEAEHGKLSGVNFCSDNGKRAYIQIVMEHPPALPPYVDGVMVKVYDISSTQTTPIPLSPIARAAAWLKSITR